MKKRLLLIGAFVCLAILGGDSPILVKFRLLPGAYAQTLKQSTASTVNVKLTKIADGTDHTGLAVTSITIKIIKHTDTLASTVTSVTCAASGSANDCVEIASSGVYNVELSASNTDTLGRLVVCAVASGDYTDCVERDVVAAASWAANIAGDVTTATAIADEVLDTDVTAHVTDNTVGKRINGTLVKGQAVTSFYIKARNSAGLAVTGATPTCLVSRDSAALSGTGVSNNAEIGSNGTYSINMTGAATTGNSLYLYCTFAGGTPGSAVPYEQFLYTTQ